MLVWTGLCQLHITMSSADKTQLMNI